MRTRLLSTLATALMLGAGALAHVFWVQPVSFNLRAGDAARVQLRVGDVFPGDALPRDQSRIVSFVVRGPGDGEPRAIAGRNGRDPAGAFRVEAPGTYVVAYASTPSPVTLAADKFETYLREKGLEKIIERRKERGQSGREAREIFSRSAKSVLNVERVSEGSERGIGLRLEITPTKNPGTLHAGEPLEVGVAFEGRPLAGALVQMRSPQWTGTPVTARTDERGMATLTLAGEGVWIVDAVEMVEAAPGSGADWESVWGSLSFQSAGAKP